MLTAEPIRVVEAPTWKPTLGAWVEDGGVRFRVWAPRAASIEVILEQPDRGLRIVSLDRERGGWYSSLVSECSVGDRYRLRIDGGEQYPDPASRYQPEGVLGPSEIVDPASFDWSDQHWPGLSPEELVIYELHVGTFSAEGLPLCRFVLCIENHDQVGNRAFGDRLNHAIDLASYRAATVLLLTVPQVPLLFMGQEWAASTPFQYFTDHEEELGRLIIEGRRQEFRHFEEFTAPSDSARIPSPQDVATFERSKLDWSERELEPHATVLRLYQALLALRHSEPSLRCSWRNDHEAVALDHGTVLLRRGTPDGDRIAVIVRLKGHGRVVLAEETDLSSSDGERWEVVLTTEDELFAPDRTPIEIDLSSPAPLFEFNRPGAVILKARPSTDLAI